jgi:hypothetical protein
MKMIYVQIKAGLGNQMFQYAFGRAKSIDQNRPLVLDVSWYGNYAKRDTPRDFILDKYNIQARIADDAELVKFNNPIRRFIRKISLRLSAKKNNAFRPSEARSRREYFEGYWSNQGYFKNHAETIRNDLTLKNPLSPATISIVKQMDENRVRGIDNISVHIRRGDCVTNVHAASYQGTVDTSYYDESHRYFAEKIGPEKIAYFVFSDDIQWARENVLIDMNTTYVSNPDIPDYEELHLMSLCSHHIIANSTFSWWGAWLDSKPNKIVIAPKQWTKDTSFDNSDVCPPEWIRI